MTIQVASFAIPTIQRAGGFQKRGSKYPFADLTAGSEQCIVLDEVNADKAHSRLSSALANYRKAGGEGKFTIRKFNQTVDGVEKTLVGCWRVE